ncbi:MAG: DUF7467 domain-containing protein, partial [Planctomycetota bacterium]
MMRTLASIGIAGLLVTTTTARGGSCCEDGRPGLLRMIYLAEGCTSSRNQQDPDKTSCEDLVDTPLPEEVWVIASNAMDPADQPAKIWFEGPVSFGDVIDIAAANDGCDELRNRTCILVYDQPDGTLLQRSEFRTSCEQPLRTGDQFGAFLLVECAAAAPPESCCENGRPAVLTMRYTGEDCEATSHDQGDDKVACEDFEDLTPMVWV